MLRNRVVIAIALVTALAGSIFVSQVLSVRAQNAITPTPLQPVSAFADSATLPAPQVRSVVLIQPTATVPPPTPTLIPTSQAVNALPAAVPTSQPTLQPAAPAVVLPERWVTFMNQWRPEASGGCAEIWGMRPDPFSLPVWLTTPETAAGLQTGMPYYFLAGKLIQLGLVDASSCPNNGLEWTADNYLAANSCGMQIALPTVIRWQNQYDEAILATARQTGIPAILLKNVFRQESQFWPSVYATHEEAGLGQITEYGADMLLRWRPTVFAQVCPLALSEDACRGGYEKLTPSARATLRGLLYRLVNAGCPSCPEKVNMDQARFSVGLFAESLLASCQQTNQTLWNIIDADPSDFATYADMWRFTLVNYNAGPGCLSRAIQAAWEKDPKLTWGRVSEAMPAECRNAVRYVDSITGLYMP